MTPVDRRVLDGVPKVAFAPIHDREFEFTPFPSCLKAVAGYRGRRVAYSRLLGATGAAFRLVWHSKRWEGGNVDIFFMAEDPLEPIRRGLAAIGASAEILLNRRVLWEIDSAYAATRDALLEPVLSDDRAEFRRRIVSSIDRGVPVIAFGVVGPPEASIIAGYDDAGDTLVGWSMFQDHLDPSHDITPSDPDGMNPPSGVEENGYFRRTDWFLRTNGIVTLELGTMPDDAEVYQSALPWITRILRGPRVYEYHTGPAAYEAYIEKLGDDGEFPIDDMDVLAARKMVHYDAMTMIAERAHGADFVGEMAAHPSFADARSDVEAAAGALRDAGRQMHGWWDIVGKIWNDEEAQVRAVGNPEVRRRFIPYVERARDLDRSAAAHLETAARTLGLTEE